MPSAPRCGAGLANGEGKLTVSNSKTTTHREEHMANNRRDFLNIRIGGDWRCIYLSLPDDSSAGAGATYTTVWND